MGVLYPYAPAIVLSQVGDHNQTRVHLGIIFDTADFAFHIVKRFEHFKGELRQTIAKLCQWQILENNISGAAICRCFSATLFGDNQTVCLLVIAADMQTPDEL